MSIFATEFPVRRDVSDTELVLATKAWITGIRDSTLDLTAMSAEDEDTLCIGTDDERESLEIRRAKSKVLNLIGVRYETERDTRVKFTVDAVLKRMAAIGIVTVRARSEMLQSSEWAPTPQKPAVIKCMLERGWSEPGGREHARLTPHYFEESDLSGAADLMNEGEPSGMPFAYMSCFEDGGWSVDPTKMANDLAGLANVYVEPSRSFSLKLKDKVGNRNPYLGAVGLWFVGDRFPLISFAKRHALVDEIKSTLVARQASRRFKRGCDWVDLLEEQTRIIRARAKSAAADNVLDELIAQEEARDRVVREKEAEIDGLREQLRGAEVSSNLLLMALAGRSPSEGAGDLVPRELYAGEVSDRVAAVIQYAATGAPPDARTLAIAKALSGIARRSGGADSLRARLSAAAKDGPDSIIALLREMGFEHKVDGKHHKLRPPADLPGIEQFTISKTSSDHRADKNLVSTIVSGLRLKEVYK